MSVAKALSAIKRSKQFQNLTDLGLKLTSTDRQLSNGTLSFSGKVRAGRKRITPSYSVTANGAVISNEFVARRVSGKNLNELYRNGLNAISELLDKRLTA